MWGKWALSFMKKKLDIFPRSGFNTPMANPKSVKEIVG